MSYAIAKFDTATPALGEMLERGMNLKPLFEAVGSELVSRVQQGFISSRSPYGVQWAALKLRQGQPLRDKGHLMSSITYNAATDSVLIGPGAGPSSKGAAVHQFGATITAKNKPFLAFRAGGKWIFAKRVTIPARPYLPTEQGGLPPSWRDAILRESAIYLMGAK
jgi:phage gpG-like protein